MATKQFLPHIQVYYKDRLTCKCCNKVSQLDNM
jgi:hypothetical protein